MLLNFQRVSCCAICFSILFLASCSDAPLKQPLFPLSGTVERDGKVVKGGGMMFAPESTSAGYSVNASVLPDGSFSGETLITGSNGRTVAHPAAPAGKYRVIYHPPSDGSKMGLEVELESPVTLEAQANQITINLPGKVSEGKGMERDDVPPKATER